MITLVPLANELEKINIDLSPILINLLDSLAITEKFCNTPILGAY